MGVSRGPPNTPTHTDTHIPAVRVVVCRVLKGAGYGNQSHGGTRAAGLILCSFTAQTYTHS